MQKRPKVNGIGDMSKDLKTCSSSFKCLGHFETSVHKRAIGWVEERCVHKIGSDVSLLLYAIFSLVT